MPIEQKINNCDILQYVIITTANQIEAPRGYYRDGKRLRSGTCCRSFRYGSALEASENARPQEILRAARDLFLQQGFRETRMVDVARHAGCVRVRCTCTTRTRKRYEAVVKEAVAPAIAFAEQRLQGRRDSAAALLKELMLGWWQEFGATPASGVLWLMVAEAALPRNGAASRRGSRCGLGVSA